MRANPDSLKVKQVIPETPLAKTIVLEVPEDLAFKYRFRAGQYIAIQFSSMVKHYWISTAPHQNMLAFTVKKATHIGEENFLHDRVEEGDILTVWPPAGQFVVNTDPDRRATYYLIASGSGITPLYAMAKDILDTEPLSTVHLLYSSENVSDILYRTDLGMMRKRYADQFYLRHYLTESRPSTFIDDWNGQRGRITPAVMDEYLLDFPKQTLTEKFFICGPEEMSTVLSTHLTEIGKDQIFIERFNNDSVKMEPKQSDQSCKAKIFLDGETIEIEVKDQTILQTLIDAGYDPPFSCTSGVCTTCMAKLKAGQVEMEVNYGLDEDEVADGFVLTCQSRPTTTEIELTYDV